MGTNREMVKGGYTAHEVLDLIRFSRSRVKVKRSSVLNRYKMLVDAISEDRVDGNETNSYYRYYVESSTHD